MTESTPQIKDSNEKLEKKVDESTLEDASIAAYTAQALEKSKNEYHEKEKWRTKYVPKIFHLALGWLAFTAIAVLMSGAHFNPDSPLKIGFTLSDKVLVTLISATLLNVLGLLFIVTKWMFPRPPT